MIDFQILSAYVFAVILLIITPGPVVALVLRNSLLGGFRAGFLTTLGTNFASLFIIGVSIAIILGIIKISQTLLFWLSLLGCVFIFYLGFSSFIQSFKIQIENTNLKHDSKNHFSQGFFIAISNPKDIIFFIAFFPQFIHISPDLNSSLFLLVILWIICDFFVLLTYAFLGRSNLLLRFKKFIVRLSDSVLMLIAIVAFVYLLKTL